MLRNRYILGVILLALLFGCGARQSTVDLIQPSWTTFISDTREIFKVRVLNLPSEGTPLRIRIDDTQESIAITTTMTIRPGVTITPEGKAIIVEGWQARSFIYVEPALKLQSQNDPTKTIEFFGLAPKEPYSLVRVISNGKDQVIFIGTNERVDIETGNIYSVVTIENSAGKQLIQFSQGWQLVPAQLKTNPIIALKPGEQRYIRPTGSTMMGVYLDNHQTEGGVFISVNSGPNGASKVQIQCDVQASCSGDIPIAGATFKVYVHKGVAVIIAPITWETYDPNAP